MAQTFDAVEIGERVGAAGYIRLYQLRERIQARGGGLRARQMDREFGVGNGQPRQQKRAAQTGLNAIDGRGKHGVASDLGAGTRGGGQRGE